MTKKLLLTSFTTWLPHQKTNSSDKLLDKISQVNCYFATLNFLRLLPVDIQLASDRVIKEIQALEPDLIVCCGMAERRQYLSLESNAVCDGRVLQTNLNLEQLLDGNNNIQISHDAGKFVCEGLYYSVLSYILERQLRANGLFVHVPVLTVENSDFIARDFRLLLQRVSSD